MKTDFLNQTHPGDVQQEGSVHTPLKNSTFPESYDFDQTLRFGEYTPHFVMDAIADDKISLRSSHTLRSFTMKSPLMQSISMKKDYFAVPMEALYPNQWDRIYTNPNIGDDVPADAYGNIDLLGYMKDCVDSLTGNISDGLDDYDACFDSSGNIIEGMEDELQSAVSGLLGNAVGLLQNCSYVFSNGSLLNYLGCNESRNFWATTLVTENGQTDGIYSFDRVFDNFWDFCFGDDPDKISRLTIQNINYNDVEFKDLEDVEKLTPVAPFISKKRFLELLHDNGWLGALTWYLPDEDVSYGSAKNFIEWCRTVAPTIHVTKGKTIDISRLYAYQIIIAHFYTNDRVDYIYSADLWRQNLYNHYVELVSSTKPLFFNWNGTKLPYDYTAAKYFDTVISASGNYLGALKWFAYVFAFRKSLRFIDYFTGSKTSPLAIGDTDVDVSSDNNVSVVDITRSIQIQRFLNAVNRMGRKFSNYIKGMFGVNIDTDYHNPLYLGHTSDVIYGQETANTGDAQMSAANSVTTVLRGNDNKFAFEFDADRPSIVIGISYFDIPRHYGTSIDRQFFIKDRFDMYNPYLEYIGDQPVYTDELIGSEFVDDRHDTDIFGYQTRYSEYKQRVSRAVGGFVEYLPGYVFISDNVAGLAVNPLISPDYIRSHPSELDEFFVSLTGDSLASYFHFIISQSNFCTANRPMSFSPQIL